ncbi:MAG: tRNA1(Val) (adenine(37)-N6)-methyltransferase [Thermodesulfovibrio sp.]|nr:tRNA1(Val) (adenine(37)-N6)-methyltransferase [Thermodesulfovibrio sp.]
MQRFTIDSIGNLKIYQPTEGYRFSVDAIILAHFVNLKRLNKAVDIGAGTGIIGMLLAKKYPDSEITMVEIQQELVEMAKKNILLNNLENRVKVYCMDAKEFEEKGFDLLVTNPPFRRPGTGKISPKEEKALARHELSLSVKDIAKIAQKILRHRGRLCMIHLPERLIDIIRIMSKYNLEVKRLRFVHSNISKEAKMVLIEAVKGGRISLKVEPPLFIYEKDREYTEEMRRLYEI